MKFFYLRDKKNNPVACVAMLKMINKMYFGVSAWNPHDVFNRTAAKFYAAEKIHEDGDWVAIDSADLATVENRIVEIIAGDGKNDPRYPARAVKAAKYRLNPPPRTVTLPEGHPEGSVATFRTVGRRLPKENDLYITCSCDDASKRFVNRASSDWHHVPVEIVTRV